MSEPETRLPTPGRVPSGSTSVGALPPLTLPPPRLDPLAGISSVHHSYASPSLATQMMPSPILQSGMMSPVSTQSPLSHQMLSPQQKPQSVPSSGQQLQDVRRQSVMLPQDQMRGQFSHTVTTVPSNKRPNEMGRQIQSVPNSPASLAISTPPQSVQVRHSSLDAQLSPGSSSVGNPSPSYSNHSSPSVVQLHNGHGPPGSYVQTTMHSHLGSTLTRYASLPSQDQLQHHVAVGSLSSSPNKQGYQHEVQSRPVHQVASTMASTTQRTVPSQTPQGPTLLQQQLSTRPPRSQSSTAIVGSQPNVMIQQQPIPQVPSSQQNGQQSKPRPIPSQEPMPRQVQSASNQQQHVVMGLLHGAQLQQHQADGGAVQYAGASVSNPHVRQILANRTSQSLMGPSSSAPQQVLQHSQPSPSRMSPSVQQQVVVPHGILPSQANLPLRSVLAAQQQQLTQQQLLQQQRPQQQQLAGIQQAAPQQQIRLSGRVAGTASGALATLYDAEKSATTLTNKDAYRILKRRFKYLVYENECYQEELRNLQRKLLKLSRDKNFLLDRLGQFEKFSDSSDEDSDASHKTCDEKPKTKKRIRPAQRKRAADEGLEGSNAVKRSAEESLVSSPSPSESPITDPRSGAYLATGPQCSSQSYRQLLNAASSSSYERMQVQAPPTMNNPPFVLSHGQNVLQMGTSGTQPQQQQILRSTLARVVPSTMLAQQPHSSQSYTSSNRLLADTRPIVAKVRVETPLAGMASSYQGEQMKQTPLHRALSKAPTIAQTRSMEFSHPQQEMLANNPVNGDNYTASTTSALGPPMTMAPSPIETNASVPSVAVSSLSSSLINGLMPDASGYVEKKEEKCSTAIISPATSQHR
ncbi:unnamed protein product [Cylicocyclus nassatus]|uniref:INO80 complex subunit E N-terminal domain-containing protein n=1 Tax=Cylicocyclus nassatus TaxID=53992 RepID=A0AA36M4Y6_CYLNA|nr:unnamed protein product [Cylicocyclus nassatus]